MKYFPFMLQVRLKNLKISFILPPLWIINPAFGSGGDGTMNKKTWFKRIGCCSPGVKLLSHIDSKRETLSRLNVEIHRMLSHIFDPVDSLHTVNNLDLFLQLLCVLIPKYIPHPESLLVFSASFSILHSSLWENSMNKNHFSSTRGDEDFGCGCDTRQNWGHAQWVCPLRLSEEDGMRGKSKATKRTTCCYFFLPCWIQIMFICD